MDSEKHPWDNRLVTSCDPREASCPVIYHKDLGDNKVRIRILGTAFFISSAGLFLTAKHVVEGFTHGLHGELSLMLLRRPNYKFAKIASLQNHESTDISIGIIDLTGEGWFPKTYKLSSKQLGKRDFISSFGYAKTKYEIKENALMINLNPDFYEGQVIEYHREGYGVAKWPVYRHTMSTLSGNSGGPVFSIKSSAVHGICCTGFNPPPGGTFSDIREILDWKIKFVQDSWNTIRGIAEHRPDMMSLE